MYLTLTSELKLGYAASKFYGDAYVANQTSTSGVDILAEGFQGFPSYKVNYTKIGLNLYTPLYKDFGLAGGASTYSVAGRISEKRLDFTVQ
jgi:hypothetical protein